MQDLACVTKDLSRGASIVQTPGATPAGPANRVGVCFLSQLLSVDSPNCLSTFPVCLLFHCFALPHPH